MRARPVWARILLTLGLATGAALFARQLWQSALAVRAKDIQVQQPGYLVLALVCVVAMYALQMLGWRLILNNLGHALGLRAAMQGFMLSFLPRYVPGSVWGYLTRGEWLARDHGIPHPVSWFGAVLEAALLCITALGMSGAYLVGTEAGVGAALMVGILTLALPGPAVMLFTRFIGARRFGIRIASPTWTGALRWTGVCLVYVGMWVLYGACTWGVGRGFFPEESWRLPPFVYASGMAWLAGFLFVIVPAGLGVRESTLEALLASAAGIPAWQGGLIAVVSRFVLILAELIWLAVGLALNAESWRRSRNDPRHAN